MILNLKSFVNTGPGILLLCKVSSVLVYSISRSFANKIYRPIDRHIVKSFPYTKKVFAWDIKMYYKKIENVHLYFRQYTV